MTFKPIESMCLYLFDIIQTCCMVKHLLDCNQYRRSKKLKYGTKQIWIFFSFYSQESRPHWGEFVNSLEESRCCAVFLPVIQDWRMSPCFQKMPINICLIKWGFNISQKKKNPAHWWAMYFSVDLLVPPTAVRNLRAEIASLLSPYTLQFLWLKKILLWFSISLCLFILILITLTMYLCVSVSFVPCHPARFM